MIEIKISGENAKEVLAELAGLCVGLVPKQEELKAAEEPKQEEAKEVEEPKKETKKSKKKEEVKQEEVKETEAPKQEVVKETEAPKQEVVKEAEAPAPVSVPSAEDIRALIQERSKTDPNFKATAKRFLTEVGAENLSAMTDEQRRMFMSKVDDLDSDVPF